MSDYERIAVAIGYITKHVSQQPTLEDIAAHLHLSPFHFQRLFCRWTGVTPKRFLQVLTVERAKQLLSEAKPMLEVSERLGLSSGSRLYDHFVQLEAVTPGEFKRRGAGLSIDHAVLDTPFGQAFIAATERGICKLAFLDKTQRNTQLQEVKNMWPQASLRENRQHLQPLINAIFADAILPDRPLSLYVTGTNFQINVWKALMQIPPGTITSYNHIATVLGRPNAARAVGNAIGANPVGFVIPCHRVIQQSGRIGGYHWGETRKHAMHAWETARNEK